MIEDEDIEIEDTQREDRHDLMMRLLMWREKHINEHNFVLILSFVLPPLLLFLNFSYILYNSC
jgi:CIC family chloride channel protein